MQKHVSPRRAALAGMLNSMAHRLRQPLPGAQPRLRFEMPPEQEDDELTPETESGTRFGNPGPRMSSQHPLYVGFMGTVGVGVALLVYWIGSNTTQLILWIVAALFIALGLDPVVRWLEGKKFPRAAGIVVAVSTLALGVAAFFATLIPTIVQQVTQIVEEAPRWITDFINSDFFRSIDDQYGVRQRISQELEKFVNDPEAMGGIFGGVVGFGSTVANGLFGALIVLVLSLYFLAALPAMKKWGYRLAPRSRRARVEALSEEITGSVGNYVIGQAVVALVNATFAFIVMSIVGVPFAVLLAFVVALLAFIPLVGGADRRRHRHADRPDRGLADRRGLRRLLLRLPAVRGVLHLAAHHAEGRRGARRRRRHLGDRRRQPAGRARRTDRHSHRGRDHAADQGNLHRPAGQALTLYCWTNGQPLRGSTQRLSVFSASCGARSRGSGVRRGDRAGPIPAEAPRRRRPAAPRRQSR